MSFVDKPHRLWIRRAMFQIHLWLGIFLSLYVVVLGVSGSILVFREELTNLARPKHLPEKGDASTPQLSVMTVLNLVKSSYPGRKTTWIQAPRPETPAFMANTKLGKSNISVYIHPVTGEILGETVQEGELWLNWVSGLHIFLLSGRTGFVVNGVGGIFLLIICISGVVIWWPGIQQWKRAFIVNFGKSWKRINFDLHSALGFWALGFLMMWALTTIYFVWPQQAKQAIGLFASFGSSNKTTIERAQSRENIPEIDVPLILSRSYKLSPSAKFSALLIPSDKQGSILVHMARGVVGDFGTSDILFFDPVDSKYLGMQRNGIAQMSGDKIISLMVPIHFGTRWGLGVKVVWGILGISLPILAVTGLLMYWNRYLGKKWEKLRHSKVLDSVSTS